MARSGDQVGIPSAGMLASAGGGVVATTIDEVVVGCEVRVAGPLDVHSVADVRTMLGRMIDDGAGDLIVHLVDAEIGDATGLGVIVGAHRRAMRAGRRLVLADTSPRLERLLRATKLGRVIAVDRSARATPSVLSPAVSPA